MTHEFEVGDIIALVNPDWMDNYKWEVVSEGNHKHSRMGYKLLLINLQSGAHQYSNYPENFRLVEKGYLQYDPAQQGDENDCI